MKPRVIDVHTHLHTGQQDFVLPRVVEWLASLEPAAARDALAAKE